MSLGQGCRESDMGGWMGEANGGWHSRWVLRSAPPGQAPALWGPCPGTYGLPNLQPQQEPALGLLVLSTSWTISVQSQDRDKQWGKWGG